MAVGAISGASGINLAQLAQMYQQQVTAGPSATQASQSNSAVSMASQTRGADFASTINNGLNNVAQLDQTAQSKAIQAATGDLTDVHDYVIAATQAQVATELTTTVRNKALDSFNEIMRMPL